MNRTVAFAAWGLLTGLGLLVGQAQGQDAPAAKSGEPAAKADAAKAPDKKDTEKKGTSKKSAEPAKPRLPANFAKVEPTAEQREKLYAIDSEYDSKVAALKDQLKALLAKRDAEYEAVLTPAQRAKLAQIREESKKKSSEKLDAKKEAAKSSAKPGDASKPEAKADDKKADAPKEGSAKPKAE